MSAAWPNRWTGRMAFVRAVTASATCCRIDIQSARIDIDEDRLRATRLIASAVAKNVNGVVITSSPRPTPSARRSEHQRIASRVARDGVLDVQEAGHFVFESMHLAAQDELSRPHDVGNCRLNVVPEQIDFGDQIEGRNLRRAFLA